MSEPSVTLDKAQELLLKIATQQREIAELHHQNDILRSETYSLPACEKSNAELAAENDSLTQRLKEWKDAAIGLRGDFQCFANARRHQDGAVMTSGYAEAIDRLNAEEPKQ